MTRPLTDRLTIAAESGDSDRGTSALMLEARDALARQARVIEQMRVGVRDPFTGCYDCAHMLDRLMAEEETR